VRPFLGEDLRDNPNKKEKIKGNLNCLGVDEITG
jgi:hypothetical protein